MVTGQLPRLRRGHLGDQPGLPLPPLGIDRNHADLLNRSSTWRCATCDDKPVWVPHRPAGTAVRLAAADLGARLGQHPPHLPGRQGVLAEREVRASMPSACSRSRSAEPVGVATSTASTRSDNNQVFAGLWTTYRPEQEPGRRPLLPVPGQHQPDGPGGAPGTAPPVRTLNDAVTTVGSRYCRRQRRLAVGLRGDVPVRRLLRHGPCSPGRSRPAAATSGRTCWTPKVWLYYDYASGTADPGTGTNHTFNQLFPFGHYYFGAPNRCPIRGSPRWITTAPLVRDSRKVTSVWARPPRRLPPSPRRLCTAGIRCSSPAPTTPRGRPSRPASPARSTTNWPAPSPCGARCRAARAPSRSPRRARPTCRWPKEAAVTAELMDK